VPPVAPGETVTVPLPHVDGVLTVRAVLAADTAWAPAGHEVAWAQGAALPLPEPVPGSSAPETSGGTLRLGPAEFDGLTGRLRSIGGTAVPGPDLALWRAPTDNDRGVANERAGLPSDADGWARSGLDRLHARVESVEPSTDALTVTSVVGAAGHDGRVRLTLRWSSDGDALRLDAAAVPLGEWPSGWARVGLELSLPWAPDHIGWDGYGPGQRYPDTGQSQRLGRFSVAGASELHTDYVKPQENGSRSGVVALTVGRDGRGFGVSGSGFAFTASPWTSAELDAAAHPTDLPPAGDRCRLVLDLAEHGIGTASCGPGVLPQYRLEPRTVEGTLVLRSL
jgi:beta-galactosidase